MVTKVVWHSGGESHQTALDWTDQLAHRKMDSLSQEKKTAITFK